MVGTPIMDLVRMAYQLSVADQIPSTADQGRSALDQALAAIDQAYSDQDQAAADFEQIVADLEHAANDHLSPADEDAYWRARSEREAGTIARMVTREIRGRTAIERATRRTSGTSLASS